MHDAQVGFSITHCARCSIQSSRNATRNDSFTVNAQRDKKKKIIKIALALFLCLIHSFAAAMEWRGRQKYFGKKADNYYLEYRCVYTAQRYTLEMIDYFNVD